MNAAAQVPSIKAARSAPPAPQSPGGACLNVSGRPVSVSYDASQRENCLNWSRPLGCHGSHQGVNVGLHIVHGQTRVRTEPEDMTVGRDRHRIARGRRPQSKRQRPYTAEPVRGRHLLAR